MLLDRLSIRTQLGLLVLAVALPAAGLVAYALHNQLTETRQGAERQLQALALDTAGRIEVVLQRRAELLARLAERPLVRALDATRCDAALAEVATMQIEFLSVALRRADGEQLCASRIGGLAGAAVSAASWFRAGLASGHFAVSGAFMLPPEGKWVAALTQPVRNADGEIGGLLVLAVDLLALQRQLLPALPAGAVVIAFDRDMRFLMRTIDPGRWIGQTLPAPQRAQLPPRTDALFELAGVDGVRRLNVGATVPSSGWQVYAAIPLDSAYGGYRALLWRSLALGACALAAASLLAWRVSRRIARPIDALAAGVAAAADGDGQAGPGAGAGGSEVAAAAADLQRLADQREALRDRHARLSASYAQLAGAARDIVLLTDRHGRIVEANAAALTAYGYSRDELLAMAVSELRAPAARGQVDLDRAAALQPQGALYETVHQRKDGSTLPVEVSARAFEVAGQLYFQSFMRDVTPRKRDEALLRGQSAVLAQVARGSPLAESLDALARLVESQVPGLLATILLLDEDGLHLRHGAAPSLPRSFIEAIDGAAIGPAAGSCGSAAYRRETVISEDINTDPNWGDWRALAHTAGLRACWSTPILDAAGLALGTFAMYFREPGRPDATHQRLVDLVTHTAAIAIASARSAHTQRAQLDELLRWQAMMIDREQRMAALKEEIDALRQHLGEAPRYADRDASL